MSEPMIYQSFDLCIEPDTAERYRAKGYDSFGRVATVAMQPPPVGELEEADSAWTQEQIQHLGERLFHAVFHGGLLSIFRASLEEARGRNQGLRIRLRLKDAPELARLPWEYLYDSTHRRFFALSRTTPVVRYLELPDPTPGPAAELPLRILVLIANPKDLPRLDSDREWELLEEALAGSQERGLVELRRLGKPTLSSLQRELRRFRPHIFHFIGHGFFQEEQQEGALMLETDQGQSQAVGSRQLGILLHDASLRLAFLNACRGAATSLSNPFSGVAQNLVQQGVAAVVAMRHEISDETAIGLTAELYSALADGYPVDASLAEARKSLSGQSTMQWGTPILFQRSPDGHLFASPSRGAEQPGVGLPASEVEGDLDQTSRSKLERAVMALGVVVALLTIAGAILDLPGKWNAWRGETLLATSAADEPASDHELQLLQGEVLDDASGLPLPGALVEIREFGQRMETDAMGRFSFELPAAKYSRARVRVSIEGYEVKNEDPVLGTRQFEVYRLKRRRE